MKIQHDGDYGTYFSLENNWLEEKICTCCYGLAHPRKTGEKTPLYSQKLQEELESRSEGHIHK